MGKGKIIWSPRAKNKLFDILDFYKQRNKSADYSKKLYTSITQKTLSLVDQPEIGRKTEIENLRVLIIKDYQLFYEKIVEDIHILLLWDSRQNPDNLPLEQLWT